MPRAAWSKGAEADLRNIFRYIAIEDHRAEIARKVVHNIRQHCDQCAEHFASRHEIGTDRSDLGEDVRSFTHQRWVVLFRPLTDTIQVLAVVDGSREYGTVLENR